MARNIDEKTAMQMAVNSNFLYYGGYDIAVERLPKEGVATKFMTALDSKIVLPSDLFIILAAYNCGTATTYSVASMLGKMREDDPDKTILDTSYDREQETKLVAYRMGILEKTGIFYKRRLIDKQDSERSVVIYSVLPEGLRFVLRMLESPMYVRSDMSDYWAEGREITRQLMVSTFIMRNFGLTTIKHFSRYKSITKKGGGAYDFRYLWLSVNKAGVKRSVIVYPFVFTNDPNIHNSRENEMYGITIPFQKLNAFLEYSENGEYEGGLVLIVDKEDDLGLLAQYVADKIPSKYHDRIMLTTMGLLRTQDIPSMYFGLNGRFVPEEKRLF